MNMNFFINQANHSKLFKEVHSIRKSMKFKIYQHNGYDYTFIFKSFLTERYNYIITIYLLIYGQTPLVKTS